MRLVDADHLVSLVNDATILGNGFKLAFTRIVNGEPTIEPERKKGKWIKISPAIEPECKKGKWIKFSPVGIYECSECGKNVMTSDIEAYEWCHGCGAKMEEGEQE